MTREALWKAKIAQLLHDPPGKPFAAWFRDRTTGKRGHRALGEALLRELEQGLGVASGPDRLMAAADRPNVGISKRCLVRAWHKDPVVTHPLAPGARLRLPPLEGDAEDERMTLVGEANESQLRVFRELAPLAGSDLAALRTLHLALWRTLPDRLGRGLERGWGWQWIPADTRCPDVTIWDHTRMTSALAFFDRGRASIDETGKPDDPWLFTFDVGPVGTFLEAARTTLDLWGGSFLLSELSFAAMQPVIEACGPEAILYPDLRRNPRFDRWLADDYADLFPDDWDPHTRASVIPARWAALVPRGGKDASALTDLEDLGRACTDRMNARWTELADTVRRFLRGLPPDQAWGDQQGRVLTCTWTAVPWLPLEREPFEVKCLPAQPDPTSEGGPWGRHFTGLVPFADLWHHAKTLEGFARHHAGYVDLRGSSYALFHHQLLVAHASRSGLRPAILPQGLPGGVTCSVCGQRPSLGSDARGQPWEGWEDLGSRVNEPRFGAERLCAVCLTRRLWVKAADPQARGDALRVVTGAKGAAAVQDGPPRNRVRFPSTSNVAAQAWIANALSGPEPAAWGQALGHASSLPRTSCAEALPRLRDLAAGSQLARGLLEYDLQTWSRHVARAEGHVALADHIERHGLDEGMGTRFAVLSLDGDGMSRLLRGSPDKVQVPWKEVLHPEARQQLQDGKGYDDPTQSPWRQSLLERARLMGPSTHAALSRMLVDFAHTVVPWVIEREFSGALVYAGGDDILALLPAADAILAAARLQQLFSAAWVVDMRPELRGAPPPDEPWNGEVDAGRFLVLEASVEPVELHAARVVPSVASGERPEVRDVSAGCPFQLPGPLQSLSAGVAVAHFKEPLGGVRQAARRMQEHAKRVQGGSALGVTVLSRGGEKVHAAVHWYDRPRQADALPRDLSAPPEGAARLHRVVQAFADGRAPGRLPYKLREAARALMAVEDGKEHVDDLRDLLFDKALDGDAGGSTDDLRALWNVGVHAARRARDREEEGTLHPVQGLDTLAELCTAPLRLARALAATGEGE